MDKLIEHEQKTIKLLSQGYTIKVIAEYKLFKSVDSINVYIKSAKRKLNAKTRDQLVAIAVRGNLI